MIKKFLSGMVVLLAALVLSGCGENIEPGFKGKIMDKNGYSADIRETGRVYIWGSESLVLLETSTKNFSVPVTVKMKDDMDLDFKVNFRTRVGGSDKVLNALFNDITADGDYNGAKAITLTKVYEVYGKDVVSNVARSVVSKYNVNQVSSNYDLINQQLQTALKAAMENNPLEISNVTMAEIGWPKIITDAIEKQQERELAIKTEANQQAIEMVKRTNALELANADREVELTRARTLRDQNEITSAGISDKLLAYRALEVQEKMAENKAAIFVPYEAMGTSGMSNRIYNK